MNPDLGQQAGAWFPVWNKAVESISLLLVCFFHFFLLTERVGVPSHVIHTASSNSQLLLPLVSFKDQNAFLEFGQQSRPPPSSLMISCMVNTKRYQKNARDK